MTSNSVALAPEVVEPCEPIKPLPLPTNMGLLVGAYHNLEVLYHLCRTKDAVLVDYINQISISSE